MGSKVAIVALLTAASSATELLDVRWQTTEGCLPPNAQRFEGHGRAEVQLVERDGGWQVTVMFFEPNGLRRVLATTCEEATRTAMLLLHLGARESTPTAEPVLPASTPVVVPTPRVLELPWNVSLTGGAAFDIGSLPDVEPRFAISGALSHGLLRLAVDVRIGLPGKLTPTINVHRAVEAQLAGCLNFENTRLAIAPCAAASVGTWASTKTTLAVASASPQLRFAASLFANIEVSALAGLRFNLVRPQPFNADEVIFTTALISADLQLTLGWRW